MKRKPDSATILRRLAALLALSLFGLLPASCVTETEKAPATPEQLIRLAAERRFRTLQRRGTLRVAVNSKSGNFAKVNAYGEFEGPEIRSIKAAAGKAGLRLFLFDARPEAIPGYIRSGRADLAIGGLKSEEIRSMLLTPVMEYKQDSTVHAFAAWEDAAELKALLE